MLSTKQGNNRYYVVWCGPDNILTYLLNIVRSRCVLKSIYVLDKFINQSLIHLRKPGHICVIHQLCYVRRFVEGSLKIQQLELMYMRKRIQTKITDHCKQYR